jgi:hypothetical protein
VVVCVTLAVATACSSTSPSPTPTTRPSTTSPAAPAERPSESPTPAAGDAPTTAAGRIRAAVEAGTLDVATSFLYRFYAQLGDERLPEAFQGQWSEDRALAASAMAALESLAPEERELLRPFLVRPTSPASYLAADRRSNEESRDVMRLATLVDDPACAPRNFARLDLPDIPVTVWGWCHIAPDGSSSFAMADQVERVAAFMTDLWDPMTDEMGDPVGDQFEDPDRQAADEPDEAGDGRLDIYIVEVPDTPYLRELAIDGLAHERAASPFLPDLRSSSYIVVQTSSAISDVELKSTLAHEFFHSLQEANNHAGTLSCPYPAPAGPCADQDYHWFVEASAVWAQWFFVPESRAIGDVSPYSMVRRFLSSAQSLNHTADQNAYASFMWPLFMQQESPNGEDAIGDAWRATYQRTGWAQIQEAIDAQLPFASHFGDFAVRVWNERLLPGEPIQPLFWDDAFDPGFPRARPPEVDPASRVKQEEIILNPFFQPTHTISEDLPELWADYYELRLEPSARRLTFDFSGLVPNEEVGVDALVKIRDQGWEHRTLGAGEVQWCLDRHEDAVEQVILVLSNHAMGPAVTVSGEWSVTVDADGCATATDTLVYTATFETGTGGDPYHQLTRESMTVRLSLAPAEGGNVAFVPFENDGSTYDATYDLQTVLASVASDCIIATNGRDAGEFEGADAVTAAIFEEDGTWKMSVAASVTIPVTTAAGPCADSGVGTQTIQLPSCDGTEIADADEAWTFDFRCQHQGIGASWSVVGTVTVSFAFSP